MKVYLLIFVLLERFFMHMQLIIKHNNTKSLWTFDVYLIKQAERLKSRERSPDVDRLDDR